jgi:hypothetical protein
MAASEMLPADGHRVNATGIVGNQKTDMVILVRQSYRRLARPGMLDDVHYRLLADTEPGLAQTVGQSGLSSGRLKVTRTLASFSMRPTNQRTAGTRPS